MSQKIYSSVNTMTDDLFANVKILRGRLDTVENQLLSLARRQFLLDSFLAEFERVSRLKESKFWGVSLYMMILDHRDAHVIHLGSWAKSVYEPGGLLRQIQGNHLRAFACKRRKSERDEARPPLLEAERRFPQGRHHSFVPRRDSTASAARRRPRTHRPVLGKD